MPYFKNENARSGNADYGHERAVAEQVKAAGFTEIQKSQYPKVTKGMLKKWARTGDETELRLATADMPKGSYILQPAGTQGFPDILVLDFNDRFVILECKSGIDGTTPMWNDNLPKLDAIYILSSGKMNATTIFLVREVITDAMLDSQVKMVEDLMKVVKKYKKINEALDLFARGWDVKFRPQNFQSGGKIKTNYFTHSDRAKCEKNALDFAKQ